MVDKRKLQQILFGMVTAASPVFATIIALRPGDTTTSVCMLEPGQAAAIEGMVTTFNSTCEFNFTVGPAGLKQW